MITFAELLIIVAVHTGFVAGTWFARNRKGGIADLRAQRDRAIREQQRLRRALNLVSRHPSFGPPTAAALNGRPHLTVMSGDRA